MQTLLLYNIEKRKSIEIKNICRKLNVSYRDVDKSEYDYNLEYILNLSDNDEKRAGESFEEEMLLMAGFNEGILNIFLTLLRKKKAAVALKAVLTETNRHFTSCELFKEISAEHKAMQSGEQYHQT